MAYREFAEAFRDSGGKWAFGITGSGPSLTLIDALEKAGVGFVTTGHESTAAQMAGGYARVSGSPSLAVTIKGPGFMNMLPGLLSNAYEGYPSLSVSESYPQDHSGARCHKWLDHDRAGGEFLKDRLYFEPDSGFFHRCWETARQEFSGPVHIDLGSGRNTPLDPKDEPSHDSFEALASALRQAANPVLIVGSAGLRAEWGSRLQQLDIPVFTTPSAKGVIDEKSPNAAGVYTGAGKPETLERLLLPATDLLVTLCVRVGEILTPAFDAAKTLHIDNIRADGGGLFPAKRLEGTTHVLSAAQITELIGLLKDRSWGQEIIATGRIQLQAIGNRYDWSVVKAMKVAEEVLPGASHVLDTGNYAVMGEHYLTAHSPNSVLGTPNGRYMGAALGYALGATFAAPNTPVVLWVGDGGLRSLAGELAMAADFGRKLLVLVMKDGYFGSVRGPALANQLSQNAVTLIDRSFGGLAGALGLQSGIVDNEEELRSCLEVWRKNPQPALLECILEPNEYIELTSAIR